MKYFLEEERVAGSIPGELGESFDMVVSGSKLYEITAFCDGKSVAKVEIRGNQYVLSGYGETIRLKHFGGDSLEVLRDEFRDEIDYNDWNKDFQSSYYPEGVAKYAALIDRAELAYWRWQRNSHRPRL